MRILHLMGLFFATVSVVASFNLYREAKQVYREAEKLKPADSLFYLDMCSKSEEKAWVNTIPLGPDDCYSILVEETKDLNLVGGKFKLRVWKLR